MDVKINWWSGSMVVDAAGILRNMTLRNFKKWCKLLRRYGEQDAREMMLSVCENEVQACRDKKKDFEFNIQEFQGKLDGTIPTCMTDEYLQEQIQLTTRHLNGVSRELTSLEKKYACLEEVVNL